MERAHYASPDGVSFGERSFKLTTLAVGSGEELSNQPAVHAVGGVSGEHIAPQSRGVGKWERGAFFSAGDWSRYV